MTTNTDIQLINEFMEIPEIYEMFQFFLENKNIDYTKEMRFEK